MQDLLALRDAVVRLEIEAMLLWVLITRDLEAATSRDALPAVLEARRFALAA